MRIAFATILFSSGFAVSCLLLPPGLGRATGQVQASPGPPTAAQARVDETLRTLEANYLRAEMGDDATLAGSILAEDFLGIESGGGALSRDQVLNNLAQSARNRAPYRIAAANMREYVFGDTACVTYTKTYTVVSSGRSYSVNVLHIFTQRNGRWQLQVSSLVPGTGR